MMTRIRAHVLLGICCCLAACKSVDEPIPTVPGPLIGDIVVIEDEFEGVPLVVAGSEGRNIIMSYQRMTSDRVVLSFVPVQQALPILMEDEGGSRWNIFGEAVSGPRMGQQLLPIHSYMGYWFAFAAFFPGVEVYGNPPIEVQYEPQPVSPDWSVSITEVFAGTGKDAIPALETPASFAYKERDFIDTGYYLREDDLIIGIKIGDEIRAYPHPILDWHEVVNDQLGLQDIAIVYCPFTGTGMAWDRQIGGELTTFGVSGFLYNNNVVPYDRKTESYWSQMGGICINGELLGTSPQRYPIIETTWGNWKAMFDLPEIISEETGYGFIYSEYPYGDYRTNAQSVTFPIRYDDKRLPRKERVHGIVINGKAKVYRFDAVN